MKITNTIFIVSAIALNCQAQDYKYPSIRKTDQKDNYFGTVIADPYRWLEIDTAPDVAEWVKEENGVTNAYLEKIPFRNKVKERITQIINYPKYSSPMRAGEYCFFIRMMACKIKV